MSVIFEKTLQNLAETAALGSAMGRALPPGAVVLLCGEMGSGKTTLAKAICEGLGIRPEIVISPTYTLVNIYPGRVPVYHVDLFRIENREALLEMDRNDWLNTGGPTLIEWPALALSLLEDEPLLEVVLTVDEAHPERRHILLRSRCAACDEMLRGLAS